MSDALNVSSEVAALAERLKDHHWRLATAESCTGGLIAAVILNPHRHQLPFGAERDLGGALEVAAQLEVVDAGVLNPVDHDEDFELLLDRLRNMRSYREFFGYAG